MTPLMDDLSTVPHDDVLDEVDARLGIRIDRTHGHYSKFNGTAGFPTGAGLWIRLAWRRAERLNSPAWTGFEATLAIKRVPLPIWHSSASWYDADRCVVWRAESMSMAASPAISQTATINSDPALPDVWWSSLRAGLRELAEHETSRICMPQEHLSARIAEIYGDEIDTTVTDWACVHGDLGWANLTGPNLTILDWEDWGLGPVGYDAACLWAASLPVPALTEKVRSVFGDFLVTRTGKLAQLMLCANVVRAYRRSGRKTPTTETMAAHADGLLLSLR